jgi:ubiquinone/menaquinone biosynthesis C-methylase UbiE
MPRDRRTSFQTGPKPAASTSWDPLAAWYDGWVGEGGSEHHRLVAIPAILRLLQLQAGESLLDVGAGQGVLAPYVAKAGATYVGIDASPRLLDMARAHHGTMGTFLHGDARALHRIKELKPASFDAAAFLLSLHDMDPLEDVLAEAARMLSPTGRLVLLITHPAFRVPRQSGWGWDEGRKLVFRRVDRYLTPLPVPMKTYRGRDGERTTTSFHRPLHSYVNSLQDCGLLTDRIEEVPAHKLRKDGANPKANERARQEIPLFLGLRARKIR